ncbi:4-hydroxy-tetrahydrodipicolinate synthase [Psychrobium sp. 1_MG-2023]|uniref:4-hydroxy-tetrahydrodipicolinate synthase n=1 Tax=Psychrobium sp. 1_MG-2023 TaxID=3062624 RepID=UPI000C3233AC|nr:4-hydroxy-tetrahydrodipicolinate synthase [Psychrobium sp. 1_MG-2023]MDP2562421.1 4-hydroxy-tetrahydrodipicolinate synthase [Psychrobium sp. 1_MG-2023]PKF56149.1 4-hydroxy-tetrahydrodipicolinate synthase [Alteromonadales bacterium alter-6D02]
MFSGSIVALVTPLKGNGEIDYQNLEQLVDFHIEQGTDGIVAVGTTGESTTLSMAEHTDVVKHIVSFVAGRVPVIGGNGSNSTAEAIELTHLLNGTGVSGMLGVTPYYNKPPQQGLYKHYQAVAAATDIPQILYNVPGRTCCDLLPETVAELAKIKNIVGIKEATGNLSRLTEIKALCDDDFLLFSGDDATGMEFMLQGGNGVISVTNNIAPKLMSDMCRYALAGQREQASAINAQLQPLHDNLFVEANPIPVKWCLAQMKLINDGQLRLPLVELAPQYHAQLLTALKQADVL